MVTACVTQDVIPRIPRMTGLRMPGDVFRSFCALAWKHAGIRLGDSKRALVAARVAKRMRATGVRSEREYLELLEKDETGAELVSFLDELTTNYTAFFREAAHFVTLQEAMCGWLDRGQRRFRFWCAASSSGEEPYTLSMVLDACCGSVPVDLRILATDISTRMLDKAKAAKYVERQLAPVPRQFRDTCFRDTGERTADGRIHEVIPQVRDRVLFKRLNLSQPPFPMNGPMDAILCRNVMIYLGTEVRQGLIAEVERLLKPGGLFFTGHAETLTGLKTHLKMITPSVFCKEAAR